MLLVPAASADSFVLSASEEMSTGLGGGWGRGARADSGWHFFWSAGGDYVRLAMSEDLTVEDRDRDPLTGRTDLVDHSITQCPDGSWLHAASTSGGTPNDGGRTFRYDADFQLVGDGALETDASVAHNDLAVVCSGIVDGVAYGGDQAFFARIGEDGAPETPVQLEGAPSFMGASLAWRNEQLWAVNFDRSGNLRVASWDEDLDLVEGWDVPADGDLRGYWGQGLTRVGQTWVLAHMARNDAEGWDLDYGDVYLSFYDNDWNLLERVQLSENTPPTGGMRPGLALDGDQLLVYYDKEVQPRLFDVELDLDAMGPPDPEADTGGPGGDCGCATGGQPGIAAALLAFSVVLRRRG